MFHILLPKLQKNSWTPIKSRQQRLTNLLPGYVVGAGGCVEGATVAVILTEERTSVLK